MAQYYSEREGMGSFSHNILALSGFSNELPVYMRRLNNAIARRTPTAVKRVGIYLSPDRIFSTPVYEAEFDPNYQIQIEVFPETKKASLHIGNGTRLLALSRLEDAQQFVRGLFPKRTAALYPKRTEHTDLQPPGEDFHSLTQARLTELSVTRYGLRVERLQGEMFLAERIQYGEAKKGFGRLLGELFLTEPYREGNLPETLLALYEVTLFDSEPTEVERAVDLIGQLFEKPAGL